MLELTNGNYWPIAPCRDLAPQFPWAWETTGVGLGTLVGTSDKGQSE